MESELASIKSKLKPTITKVSAGIQGAEMSIEENLIVYEKFFDSGAQNWYPLFIDITYSTLFLQISKPEAHALILQHNLYNQNPKEYKLPVESGLELLLQKISSGLHQTQWKQAFVKLSTRSPKDSQKILTKGLNSLESKLLTAKSHDAEAIKKFISKDLNLKISMFSQCVQDNFCIETGSEALEVLISSERVFEDLEYAFSNEPKIPFENAGLQIVLREWTQSIPIHQEFRGFVWEGSLNAIGQYYHSLFFPELLEKKQLIQDKLTLFFMEKIKPKLTKNLKCCIVDLAILNENTIKLIEINPFDGKSLASLKGSTGLFDLDDPKDLNIVQKGPFELRLREKALSDIELRMKLNVTWKDMMKNYL